MTASAWFEHRFWLQILGDHARFIENALPPKEVADIQLAQQFITQFDQLLAQARSTESSGALAAINQQAYTLTVSLRTFKLGLLDRMLVGKVQIGLTPTFINHMVNELEEYVRVLTALLEGKPVPIYEALHHDLLWLLDAGGHAAAIAMELDAVEKRLLKKSRQFERHFNAFYLKAIELTGFTRTMRREFPALARFHDDVNAEMRVFMAFLKELDEIDLSSELLSRLNPLVPDHMYREECYYLLKLSQSAQVEVPNCDPTKPRVEK
ncbi:DUF2935 domain-containing protein [Paenibacillus oryzisoli]|uniref:DUF2935 domain-containing protein n=1 Tax=Paenibacillus oryzisoli TaxID=1850517 RepID=UPI003D284F99